MSGRSSHLTQWSCIPRMTGATLHGFVSPRMTASRKVERWDEVLWCFVLNPHRRSPNPNSQLELRDKLRVSSPVRAIGTDRVLLLPPLFVFFTRGEVSTGVLRS